MKALSFISATLLLLTACGGNSDKNAPTSADSLQANTDTTATTSIEGEWIQPISGMDGLQGIKFGANGKASSINMATLQYETWTQNGDTIIVTGTSIGNGQTLQMEETFVLEGDSLVRYANGNATTDKLGRRS